MAAVSSGISLTDTFYLRDYYKNNRSLVTSSNRKRYTNTELSYEDSLALRRAIKQLGSYEYSSSENGGNIYGAIQGFIKTYNNTLDSASKSGDYDIERQSKRLKKATQENADALSKVGITINKNGSLSYSENILKGAKVDDIKAALGKENKYLKELSRTTKHLYAQSYDEVYALATGTGTNVNLTL